MDNVLAILPFTTDLGNEYVYDDCTGMIFPSWPELRSVLADQHNLSGDCSDADPAMKEALVFAQHWITTYGAFLRRPAEWRAMERQMREVSPDSVREALADVGFRQLVLNLTEDCNLRCRYCSFSSVYALTRNRTTRTMPAETGMAALDYFFREVGAQLRRHPARHVAVGFYGGEPLLARGVMQQLVHHARATAPCPVLFTVTTNGTLLDDSMADFLVENEFNIVVSLDGNRAHHNDRRPYSNGKGSHRSVCRHLMAFRRRYPLYQRIRLTAVLDWESDLHTLDRYFAKCAGLLPSLGRVSFVSPHSTSYYERFSSEEHHRLLQNQADLEQQYLESRLRGEMPTPLQLALFEERDDTLVNRKRQGNTAFPFLPLTGTCVPGVKLSIRTDGTIDVCDRVNGTMPIGDVWGGLNVRNIIHLIRTYTDAVCGSCLRCPITKLCRQCFASCDGEKTFRLDPDICVRSVAATQRSFSRLYSAAERRPDAYRSENPEEQLTLRDCRW
jgi:uncharacterized protein